MFKTILAAIQRVFIICNHLHNAPWKSSNIDEFEEHVK